jgi:hypothetical protein
VSDGGSGSRVECRGKGGQGPNHATVCSAGAAWAAGSIGAGVCPIAAALHLDGDAVMVVVVAEEDDRRAAERSLPAGSKQRADPNRAGKPFISRPASRGGAGAGVFSSRDAGREPEETRSPSDCRGPQCCCRSQAFWAPGVSLCRARPNGLAGRRGAP